VRQIEVLGRKLNDSFDIKVVNCANHGIKKLFFSVAESLKSHSNNFISNSNK